MMNIIDYLRNFNYATILIRLILAAIAGGVIGNERGRHGRAAGLRTHILVCIGSALTALTGYYVYSVLEIHGDVLRLAAQVVSGIGFLGAGMIIVKNSNIVTGLTTAAGMWATAAIGIALGYGFYTGAAMATIICVFTASFLTRLEQNSKKSAQIYAEVNVTKNVGDIIDRIRRELDCEAMIEPVAPKSNTADSVGFYITVSKAKTIQDIRTQIDSIDGVIFAVSE